MKPLRLSSVQDLKALMMAKGNVRWAPQREGAGLVGIYSYELAELLRRTVNAEAIKCNRLTISGVRLVGPLDLSGAGKLGAPIVPFELINCCLEGGIDTSHAYLQGVILKNCSLMPAIYDKNFPEQGRPATLVGQEGEPSRLRFTGATIFEKVVVDSLTAPNDAILDFSHTTLSHGCLLQNIARRSKPEDTYSGKSISAEAIACVTFANAVISGGLKLCGVHINAKERNKSAFTGTVGIPVQTPLPDGIALNCTELHLQGSLYLGHTEQQGCKLYGQLALTGADIRGEVRCRGVLLLSHPWEHDPDPPITVASSGLSVGGSLHFWNIFSDDPVDRMKSACVVIGHIDLSEAHIGGDLEFAGQYDALDHTRLLNAKSAVIKGDVRFGWLLGKERSCCSVNGEVDFSNAQIGGKFVVSGANLRLSRPQEALIKAQTYKKSFTDTGRAPQRWAKFAVKLVGAKVHNNVVLQGANTAHCTVEGLALTGATIDGQLVIEGVTVQAVKAKEVRFRDGKSRKAISANGAIIRGGIYVSVEADVPRQPTDNPLKQASGTVRRQTQICGDFRLRNAMVHGPVLFRGVKMESSDCNVAFWASGATFGSDLIFQPTESAVTDVSGEVRIWGSTVQGNLKFEAVRLTAEKTGSALDASLVTVLKAVYIGQSTKASGVATKQSEVTGLINLNYMSCALLTIGADPPTGPVIIPSEEPADVPLLNQPTNPDKVPAPTSLELKGAILLREARVKGPVVISEVELKPCNPTEGEPTLAKLKELAIFNSRIVIYAAYAELGTRLFVRLKRTVSEGEISLYGARTGTIGALYTGKNQVDDGQELVDEDWGEKPDQVKGWRTGNPNLKTSSKRCITLNLDEFRYDRLHDKIEPEEGKDKEQVNGWTWLWWAFIGRPSPTVVLPRHGWLRHQVSNAGMPNELVTWPYRQLAKVYRDMGDLRLAYVYEVERRWLEIRHGHKRHLQRAINFLFGFFFGFGYSSPRACIWLVIWFFVSSGVLAIHIHYGPSALPLPPLNNVGPLLYESCADALRMLVPDALKFSSVASGSFEQSINTFGSRHFFFGLGVLRFLGRILVIGATLTVTGVLQESAPVASSVKD